MNYARFGHTMTPLPNGEVLVVGGYYGSYNGPGQLVSSAELYTP